MKLLLYILWMSSVGLGLAQTPAQYPSGWFGNGCIYKCRCNTSCESDGFCSPGSICQQGWFGPACQYLDLAQNSSVTPWVHPNNVLTDGNDTTCNTDNTLQTFTLSWAPFSYTITWLRLKARNIDSLNTVTVQFSKDGGNTFLNVNCVKSPNIDSRTKDVFCDLKTTVNLVKLAGEGAKALCSVYVSGGRNVALKQATVQSGNYSENGIIYGPERAVDGNINPDFYQGKSCTATSPGIKPAYWSVSLSQPVTVSRYVLYNRADDSLQRLQGFQLTSFDVNKAQVYLYNDNPPTLQKLYNVVPDPAVSRISSVKVTAATNVDLLTICEFEMFGDTDCDAGRYGRECEHTCNCADQREPCFVSTGGCPSGCAAGYMGEACAEHCDSGWFGLDCRFKCHCSDNTCQPVDGQCNTCELGWFGPECQYVDMMQTSNELQQSPVKEISDGNDTTCITNYNQSVTVTWNNTFYFTWLRVAVQDSNSLKSLTVTFNDTSNPVPCTNQRSATVIDRIVDIHCDLTGPVNKVTLTGAGVSSLCSVYISGGRNVALRQPTSQSGTYTDTAGISYGPEKAVDGNTSGDFDNDKSCTATAHSSPNWNIAFLHPIRVFSYVIYNRVGPDEAPKRLQGFTLTSFNAAGGQVDSYTDDGKTLQNIYTVLPTTPSASISRVNIRVGAYADYLLTLCEVEVYGETVCEPGRFGRECENSCNCTNTHETCFVSTGGCPGCPAGYKGITCTESCSQGTYGEDCKFNCSSHCVNHTNNTLICDNFNGTCDNGCHDGYARPLCKESCPPGKYGKDCDSSCSENCIRENNDTSFCDPVNGTCKKGCLSGYIGPLCNTSCETGKYGKDCSSSCSENCLQHNNGVPLCDHVNGTCDGGCHDGYIAPLCERTCPPGTFGSDCNSNCSQFCVDHDNNGRPVCDNVNGRCQNGCLDGYLPPFCNQSCGHNTYGKGCKSVCSEFCGKLNMATESSCNHISGICILGCQSGYENSMCTEECNPGKYGPQCRLTCSEFCLNNAEYERPCNHINGTCLHGCVTGYEGSICKSVCSSGTYGKDCRYACDHICVPTNNTEDSSCDYISGNCLYGCLPGYSGPICSKEPTSSPSSNTGFIIGICMAVIASNIITALVAFICYRRKIRTLTSAAERPYNQPDYILQQGQQYSNVLSSGDGYESSTDSENRKTSLYTRKIVDESSETIQSGGSHQTHTQSTTDDEKGNIIYEEIGGDRRSQFGDANKMYVNDI